MRLLNGADVGEIPIKYLGGAGGSTGFGGHLDIESTGVAFRRRKAVRLQWAWSEVQRIAFEDPGRTKANVGAIAVFGIWGLSARRAFSLVIVSTTEGDVFFESPFPIGTWRSVAVRIPQDVPEAAGRIVVDGVPVGAQPAVASPTNYGATVLEQLQQLGHLRDSGVLTTEEFDAKKAELLKRL
jgi:hypothetical protein